MSGWTRCLHCENPVIGAGRREAQFCRPRCLEEGLLEAVRLDARLGLGHFQEDGDRSPEQRVLDALEATPLLHRRGLLHHAIAAWRDEHGDDVALPVPPGGDAPAPATPESAAG